MGTLGSRISEELNKKNLTQKELAKLVGTTEVTIGRYINDKREPNASMLFEISKVLGVSTDYLLGRSSNPHTSNKNKTQADELEQEFPEGISVLYRANEKLTPEQKEMMLRMIKASFFENEEK